MAVHQPSAPGRPPRVALVAGEASGDLLGAHLIEALKARMPGAEFLGIAGPRMQAAGARSLHPMERLSVRGYVEALRAYPGIMAIRRKLAATLLADRPDVFIGIDAPDFNLGLELKLRQAGIRTVHYVSPSIWAWRRERIDLIRRACDRVLTLFPFEGAIYREAGIPSDYVGHPLAGMLPAEPSRAAMREQLRLPQAGRVITLMPGSRQSEVAYMADTFVETARRIHALWPETRFLVPLVTRETRRIFEDALYAAEAGDLPLTILFGHAHDAMVAADGILIASGTATLEAALLGRPMVITYRMSPFSWRLIQRKRYQPWVGLPNILAGRFLVPELLQDDATPDNLAQALTNLVADRQSCLRLETAFRVLREELTRDTAALAADAVLATMGEARAAA